jgi:hypothetical protein
MTRRCSAFLLLLVAGGTLGSGLSHAAWQKIFGSSGAEVANSVRQTTDKGYIIAGYTTSYGAGGEDVYLIKTDANGNKTWQKTFGTTGEEWAQSVQQTSDGGFIIAGSSADARLIKTDANGKKSWQKTFGGFGLDGLNSVEQTKDGGYILAGYTSSYGEGTIDVYLIKTDANGKKTWQRVYGGDGSEVARAVKQTSDNGYIIAGYTTSYGAGSADVFLIKTNSNGNKTWQKTFGGEKYDEAYSVQQTADSGFIVAGRTQSYGAGGSDVWLIKTDSTGKKMWQRTFGSTLEDEAHSVQQTQDGGFIIAGFTTRASTGYTDVFLIKTDADGKKSWQKTLGGSNAFDYANCVQQTKDGGFIIAGSREASVSALSDVYLIKTDAQGN